MEHIYALFDRRCHTQTALGKLQKLQQFPLITLQPIPFLSIA
jgi:hypothetical protein